MPLANPLVLNDGTADRSYSSVGYGPSERTFTEPAASFATPATVRVAHSSFVKNGIKTRRSLIQIVQTVEDAVSGKQSQITCNFVIEIPLSETDKATATKVARQMADFITKNTYVNLASVINGEN